MQGKKIVWIDNTKTIAMILVALGHFFQSMTASGIIANSSALSFFNTFIYYFHVPLFFICSGFLYQKYSKAYTLSGWKYNVLKKFTAFAIPYFFFNIVSYFLKTAFSSYVNNETESLISNLFIKPSPPFWFLLVLFLIFVITPNPKPKHARPLLCAAVVITLAVYILCKVNTPLAVIISRLPDAIYYTLLYEFWFVLGMALTQFDIIWFRSPFYVLLFASAFIVALLGEKLAIPQVVLYLLCGLLACFGIIGFVCRLYRNNRQTPVMGFLSKYSMPIFLMHTIAAAGVRAVLSKIGITNAAIHIAAGLTATFALPIIAEIIMDKIHLDILVYPLRYIKFKNPEREALTNENSDCK